jgi:enamine deaminase RidA (YjgF/YER057c/UK114 family)
MVSMKTLLLALALVAAGPQADPVRYVDSRDGTSAAVIVDQLPLVHTAQILPVAGTDPESQIESALEQLTRVLQKARSCLDRLVKVNVCVAREDVVPVVQRTFAKRFTGTAKPAVAFVVGKLRHAEALVALDAVAVSEVKDPIRAKEYAVLPPGPSVYLSGEPEKGPIVEAAKKSLETLRATWTWLGLKNEDILHVKVFLTPTSSISEVEKTIASFFGESTVPPLVFVEWAMPLPIEIEVIARAPAVDGRESLEYLNPPGVKASAIYSRAVRVNRGKTIYISGLYGRQGAPGEPEVVEIFEALRSLAEKTGSDLRHLVKATYYPSAEGTSKKLNEVRPRYYDPQRPPAASKAVVPGVGMAGKTITIDMIAVQSTP